MVKRAAWLSITPEPERELPGAVATLRCGAAAQSADIERERARIERLLLRGTQRQWLRYLHEVVELIEGTGRGDEVLAGARRTAAVVIANHHNLLLALPGRGARVTASDRARLADDTPPRVKGSA
jgi:hypothetical protein